LGGCASHVLAAKASGPGWGLLQPVGAFAPRGTAKRDTHIGVIRGKDHWNWNPSEHMSRWRHRTPEYGGISKRVNLLIENVTDAAVSEEHFLKM